MRRRNAAMAERRTQPLQAILAADELAAVEEFRYQARIPSGADNATAIRSEIALAHRDMYKQRKNAFLVETHYLPNARSARRKKSISLRSGDI
jgi:hypothetical protein